MAMSLLNLLMLASVAWAQSVVPALPSMSSCVKRSIIVYTSDSATYFVTDVGTSTFPSTPTFCANASVSTVITTRSASTVTVYSQATSSQQSAGPQTSVNPVITDNSFEDGTSSPFNSSSSGSSVTAEVVQNGIYEPHTGNNYLLISFNETAPAQGRVRRQSSSPDASLVYNVTQMRTGNPNCVTDLPLETAHTRALVLGSHGHIVRRSVRIHTA